MTAVTAELANHEVPQVPNGPVTFTFEGRSITAGAGQSIAAALYAAGLRVFSRSFKYHRPRGLFCCSGDCPNCLMQVDGRPNVRTCIESAREGQVVSRQNAWPSADFDLLRIFDRLHRFLPVGFYYKSFHKPRWVWPIFEHTVRHIAGLGRIDVDAEPDTHCEVEHLHADVCVVGAGPAGMAAAATAALSGCQVLLLEQSPACGGDILHASESLQPVNQEFQECSHASVLYDTMAFGLYEDNLLGACQAGRLLKIRARQIIICTGGRERPFVFHKNDLPGIMLGSGALRLAQKQNVRPGRRAVVLTDDTRGYRVAEELAKLGIELAAVIDTRPAGDAPHGTPAWPVLASSVVTTALGGSRLKGVRVARLQDGGQLAPGSERQLDCDLLCLASALVPANELLLQGGIRFTFEGGHWVQTRAVPGVLGAGAAAGTMDFQDQILEGRLRGAEAVTALGRSMPSLEEYRRAWGSRGGGSAGRPNGRGGGFSPITRDPRLGKRFVCLCEDVTDKDLEQAVAEGFDGIETLKRYTTVNMGPCQGKMCGTLAVEVCAHATGRPIHAVGTTTSRPPSVPVDLCVLAAAAHHPVRRTALHHWHQSAGARWMDAGQWKRPESYGDPIAEVLAVRNGVGLIDVSTLGKIEVAGPDAAQLLERVYINKWSDLKIGRSRYGVMCNEDGIIFDDGVCARLAPDRFYLTATTGNAEGVYQWLELWRATWRLNVRILNHTSGMAAMNLAGPRSRDVLGRLTTLDITNAAFPYMGMRHADVAGVTCRLLRIGFVGELGYEIHCPSAVAWPLWESLCDAGREIGLVPFGVESQRILRLEKGHIIIGADTDALSNPLEAGLEPLVRLDKPEFIGRAPLLRMKERGPHSLLVGFMVPDRKEPAPEGAQVVENGYPVGRVTSARVSPTVGVSLGLAWLPANRATAGNRFLIRWNGSDVDAIVSQLPFYDPKGERLRM
jgi:sarcosine oxidase subunit alpha